MAQQYYNINLQIPRIPLLSEFPTRTVMVGPSGRAEDEAASPHVIYCENVFPTDYGLESVQFYDAIADVPASINDFLDVRIIFGSTSRNRIYLAINKSGVLYVLDESGPEAPVWIEPVVGMSPAIGTPYDPERLTTATVNGVTYIYYYNQTKLYTYNESTNEFESHTTTGLTMGAVLGFTSSNGYLIAYTDSDLAWSSTVDPLDFAPSEITGAGGGAVADIDGAILFVTPSALGINIYTEANVVSATYTGNVQYPFKLREVENSKGGINLSHIAYEANSDPQFVYTRAGLQTIDSRKAETILPEVTDFLSGRRLESYDTVNNRLNQGNVSPTKEVDVKLKYINSRYLVISYGENNPDASTKIYSNALIYDTSLNRTGKIKMDHTDVFEYIGNQVEVAKQVVTLLHVDGSCTIAYFNPGEPADDLNPAIVILGKLQSRHSRMMHLMTATFESVGQYQVAELFESYAIPLLDGKDDNNAVGVAGYPLHVGGNNRVVSWDLVAKNFMLVIKGKFRLTTALITYTNNGRM